MALLQYESEYFGVSVLGDAHLMHHGIKGQKWGVRRFQNTDGSLTDEGKRRYSTSNKTESFKRAERKIKSQLSTEANPISAARPRIQSVMQRGNLTGSEASACIKLANRMYKRAVLSEPTITNDVVTAVRSAGCSMYGLNHRLKKPGSMASKIGASAKEDNITFEEASSKLSDAIRYTAVVGNTDDYVKSYNDIKNTLEKKGYTETRCKNYFEKYKAGKVMHKSVQSVFENKDGDRFELQFHTVESQAAKYLKLPIYNARRKAGLSDSQKQILESKMKDLAEQVTDPKDIDKIKSH